MVLLPLFAAKSVLPSAVTEIARSLLNPVISPSILLVAVFTMVILSPMKFVTYRADPSGLRRTPWRGCAKPVMTARGSPLARSKRVTVLAAWLFTYIVAPSLLSTVPKAPGPAGRLLTVFRLEAAILATVPRLLSET